MLLQFDGTLIVIAVSFIIFMFVMQKIFYAPISEVREERDNYINQNVSVAQNTRQEAEDLVSDYNSKIANAKIKASQTVSDRAYSANREKARVLLVNSKEADKKVVSAINEIQNDKNNATNNLRNNVLALAHSISTKILGEEIPISGITQEMIDKEING
jgi:F-type H+-transporting ATPase subunit b